jgi:hypothetical protein
MNDGPFPEQNEPIKLPIGTNPLRPQVVSSPLARIFASDRNNMGNAETFPYVATTYSITELFRHWTMMLAFSRGALGHRALFPVALVPAASRYRSDYSAARHPRAYLPGLLGERLDHRDD